MDAFTVIDWMITLQIILIWFYIASKAGQWITLFLLRKGWCWWNRKDEKTLAWASFSEAFNLDSIKPGQGMVITTGSGMTISIHKPKQDAAQEPKDE